MRGPVAPGTPDPPRRLSDDGTSFDPSLDARAMRDILKRQYHAVLAMLRDTIQRCPDELWTSDGHHNAFWQVAYHTLFYTHLYLGTDEAAFRPWEGHQGDVQHPDGLPGPSDPSSSLPPTPDPYTKDQVLAYWAAVDGMVGPALDAMDLNRPESGFYWYAMPKLEHQLVNLRHLAHHTGQLADRLRAAGGAGTRWVKSGPGDDGPPPEGT